MTEQEILNTAAKTESDGRAFYLKAAKEASNELAAKMFESLAAEEAHHLAYIEALMAKRQVAHQPSRLLADLKTIFSGAPRVLAGKAAASQSDLDAIAFAFGIEEASYNFYKKWQKESDSPAMQQLCAALAEEENNHWRLFSQLKEYLEKTGDWFMVLEGWNFEGA